MPADIKSIGEPQVQVPTHCCLAVVAGIILVMAIAFDILQAVWFALIIIVIGLVSILVCQRLSSKWGPILVCLGIVAMFAVLGLVIRVLLPPELLSLLQGQ
jgi:small-conductance mechanosensitive channel